MKLSKLLLAGGLASIVQVAIAGDQRDVPVEINSLSSGGFAHGNMLTTRNSENDVDFIGCGVRHTIVTENGAQTTRRSGFCQAAVDDGTERGERAFCSTENPDLLDALDSLVDFGFLQFAWNDEGECTRIGTSMQSFYLPGLKVGK